MRAVRLSLGGRPGAAGGRFDRCQGGRIDWVNTAQPAPLVLRGQRYDASRPAVMGIINRTADSFYAAARYADLGQVLARADQMVAEGADIIDVGGVRAGQQGEWVDEATEIDQVLPLLRPCAGAIRRSC